MLFRLSASQAWLDLWRRVFVAVEHKSIVVHYGHPVESAHATAIHRSSFQFLLVVGHWLGLAIVGFGDGWYRLKFEQAYLHLEHRFGDVPISQVKLVVENRASFSEHKSDN